MKMPSNIQIALVQLEALPNQLALLRVRPERLQPFTDVERAEAQLAFHRIERMQQLLRIAKKDCEALFDLEDHARCER
jgi:hypothetical protein